MQMPNFNTIAMGVLSTIFLVLGVSFLSELVFHVQQPEVKGYKIEVATAEPAADEEAEAEPEIGVLLASASADAGESISKRCVACHSFDEGGANKVGPALWDVVNRAIGGLDSFGSYSSALLSYGEGKTWNYEELNGFLKSPKDWISGTSMGFAGLRKPEDRADIIAYLRAQSGDPAPLPAE